MRIECNASASQGAITSLAEVFSQETNRALGKIFMPRGAPETYPPRDALVPLRGLPGINEIDAILRSVVGAEPKEVHAAIQKILNGWPGRKRGEFWARLRQLRNNGRERGLRNALWNEEDVEILRLWYAQGPGGARRAVKAIRARHPDWSPRSIWDKAASLGLSARSGNRKPWSAEEQGYLLWNAGEKPVGRIAKKLGRSVRSIRQKLSSLGVSGKVRNPKGYTLHRVAKMLGVSDRIVRLWFQEGLFGEPASRERNRSRSGPWVSQAGLVAFCRKHPGKINTRECGPDFWPLMEDEIVPSNAWQGLRQHLTEQKQCPDCGRIIRGNAFFRHVKRCTGGTAHAREFEAKSVAAN
jgi:MerR HTH family regulatory protein